MRLIRQVVRRYWQSQRSPLLLGAILGMTLPLMNYWAACTDPEYGFSARHRLLDRLPDDIPIFCLNGLVAGLLVDLLWRSFLPGQRFTLPALFLMTALAGVSLPLVRLALGAWFLWMRY